MELRFQRLRTSFSKVVRLERSGRFVGSLLFVDAAGLGLWLFALNGFVFGRSLDSDDYSTIMVVAVACYAACLQYGLRPGRPGWEWVLKGLAGEAAAAAILCPIFAKVGLDLSTPQLLGFFALHLPLHLAGRGAYLLARRRLPEAPLELPRLVLVGGASLGLISAFVTRALVGSGDAGWYSLMVADFVSQWRAGVFPVFAGQTAYAFNGSVNPLRFAPYFQHFAGVLDLLTAHALSFIALQNLALVLSAVAAGAAAYFCTADILPRRRWTAAAFALLYVACPGVVALAYSGNLFMSVMALPYIPLVIHALWRSLEKESGTGAVTTALPLAAAWWCHAPIALWLTLLAVIAHAMRLAAHGRDDRVRRDCLQGAVLFILGAGFVFVSVRTVGIEGAPVDRADILRMVQLSFPGILLPVGDGPMSAVSNFQPGWSLLAVLLVAAGVFAWRPQRSSGLLLASAALLLALLLPIPGLTRWLWFALPQIVCTITFTVAAQRFPVILAAIAVIAGAAAVAALARRFPRSATGLSFLLIAGLGWSWLEAAKFIQPCLDAPPSVALTQMQDDVHNLVLTRYSFNPFAGMPSYFSHGYIDPYLENRVWAPDRKTVSLDNAAAAQPPDAATPLIAQVAQQVGGIVVLDPPFAVTGGIRYAVRFEPLQPLAPGSLIAEGQSTFREYFLPDSGAGMAYATPERAFGLLPTSRDFFPIWTARAGPDTVNLRYVFRDPAQGAAAKRAFARLRIQSYDIARLPVRIEKWTPYQAGVESPAGGSWLETPRLFIAGYRATVNGRPAAVARSADGRVLVALTAGSDRVILSYPGPLLLRLSYDTALLTWLLLGLRALSAAWRRASRARRSGTGPAPAGASASPGS